MWKHEKERVDKNFITKWGFREREGVSFIGARRQQQQQAANLRGWVGLVR